MVTNWTGARLHQELGLHTVGMLRIMPILEWRIFLEAAIFEINPYQL